MRAFFKLFTKIGGNVIIRLAFDIIEGGDLKIRRIKMIDATEKSIFYELLQAAKRSESPGTYAVEVREVLAAGQYSLDQPEVAIIKDAMGRIWALPEGKSLVSRHDVRKGMRFRLKVTQEGISEVLAL